MKKTWCAAFLLAMLTQPVLAAENDWKAKFIEAYDTAGLDPAVANALDAKVAEEDILLLAIERKIDVKLTMKNLHCFSVDPAVVKEKALKTGIAADKIKEALYESIQECGSKLSFQDRDIEKLFAAENGSGAAPEKVQGQQPQPAVSTPTLIDTGKNEGQQASPH